MIDIKGLIAERQRRNPTFRVTLNARTGQYYVQNQVFFQYPVNTSPEEAARLAQGYIDQINQARKAAGQALLTVKINVLPNAVVSIIGQNAVELIGGPTPHPTPPPPPWRPDAIRPDQIMVIQVLNAVNQMRPELIPQSQLIAGGINAASSNAGGINAEITPAR